MKIQIPASLKKQLTDDWEYIAQKDKVSSIFSILCTYFKHY